MKITVAATNAKIDIRNDKGEVVFAQSYSEYNMELDVAKLIPMFGDLITKVGEEAVRVKKVQAEVEGKIE